MGIYNRDYYRELPTQGDWGLSGLTPVVKFLIIANIAVFLLQIFVVRQVRFSPLEQMRKWNPELDKLMTQKEQEGPEALEAFKKEHPQLDEILSNKEPDNLFQPTEKVSVIQEWFELDTGKVVRAGQIWRLLTHAFCHDRRFIFHILVNMLCLYWFGGTLEMMYGSREFLLFYLTAAVVAALTFVGLDLYTGSTGPGIGASGAVLAVMMLYTMHFPCETICFCWFFPLEMRWLMLFYVIWDLHPVLLALSGDQFFTGVAHSAHLGGLALGFLYAKYEWRLADLVGRCPGLGWEGKQWLSALAVSQARGARKSDPELGRVDQLLQKISQSGQDSLTDDERVFLREAGDRIKNRPKRDG